MPTEFPMNHPNDIWQNQPVEGFKMSLAQLNQKLQKHERAARRRAVSTLMGVALCGWFALGAVRTHELVPRIGLALLSVWGLYYAVHGYRWIWPGRLPSEADLGTTLRCYRSALEKQRDYVLHIWVKGGLVVAFLAIAMFLLPSFIQTIKTPRLLLNFAPLFVLAAIWLALFIPKRRRSLRKMQQEIQQLRALENESAV